MPQLGLAASASRETMRLTLWSMGLSGLAVLDLSGCLIEAESNWSAEPPAHALRVSPTMSSNRKCIALPQHLEVPYLKGRS